MLKRLHLDAFGIFLLVGITLCVNLLMAFLSILPDHDPTLYGNIAKHIALTNDWSNLVFNNADWLDKPHFPFWITALSFQLFGVSSLSYFIPGFIFHLIGAYYTYRLAEHLYSKQVALLSLLIYVSACHLLISTIDLKAETYLIGQIMPACYYWLLYHEHSQLKLNYLFLGSFFTALAIMTKGIFVLVTIGSGLCCLLAYHLFLERHNAANLKQFARIKIKWILALILSFIFIAPELISLYLQFDAHPEKIVFNKTGVSGLKWFFWDSQLGRFFNSGPITRHTGSWHYLFFVIAFMWSFLPWSVVFIAMLRRMITSFNLHTAQQKRAAVYLLGCFFPTFIMFSLSAFQLEHYINIIIPFAAILSAYWINTFVDTKLSNGLDRLTIHLHLGVAFILTLLALACDILLFSHLPILLLIAIVLVLMSYLVFWRQSHLFKVMVYPVLAINLVFSCHMLINRSLYSDFDAGYKLSQFLETQPLLPLVEYRFESWTLSFHLPYQLPILENKPSALHRATPYYLVIKKEDFAGLKSKLGHYDVLFETTGITNPTRLFSAINKLWLTKEPNPADLNHYLLLRVAPPIGSV